MGAEQADGLIVQEHKPTLNEIISSTDEQVMPTSENQNFTQYYYERKEINTSNIKSNSKDNTKEEPDSTTITGNRVIQVGMPTTIYEKRVISKTIKKEANISTNNTTTTTTQTKIIKTEKNINEEQTQIIQKQEVKKEIVKDNINNININSEYNINDNLSSDRNNKINVINNSIKKKNIVIYNNPSVKKVHKNIPNKNLRQKNFLPKINIDLSKSSNDFIPINNNNKIIKENFNTENINTRINPNKSLEKIDTNISNINNTPNKILSPTNKYISNKIQLKKIEMSNIPTSQRSHSPDINSIKRKTINRGEEIKNVQITHIICTNKIKNPNFHITEKLSTNNMRSNPLTITVQDREKLKKGGKSTYSSSCTEYRPVLTQNLKGKTTVYQHARGIGMTNDRRNSNSNYYTSDIKKFEPIVIKKEKEKLEHIENFRSTKYRNSNCNTIDVCGKSGKNKIKTGDEIGKENENIENKNVNVIE